MYRQRVSSGNADGTDTHDRSPQAPSAPLAPALRGKESGGKVAAGGPFATVSGMSPRTSESEPPSGSLPPAPPLERLAELRRAAGDYVQRVVGVPIDTSEESLAFVDHYITQVREKGDIKDEVLLLVASALGVHLGEVAIGKFGGRWQRDEPLPPSADVLTDALGFRVALTQVPLVFAPVGMAAAALRLAEVEGYDATIDVPVEFRVALTEALARVSIPEDEYYSLTGRLESLAFTVDVLAELTRQQAERVTPVDNDEVN